MLAFVTVLILCLFQFNASSPHNPSRNGIILEDNDLKTLLDEGILSQYQIDYLRENYYTEFQFTNIHKQPQQSNQTSFSIYHILSKIYYILSNSLHWIGCLMLSASYVIFMFSAMESGYSLIGITLAHFYVFHMMFHLVTNTVLSMILCMFCCFMPSIIALIYVLHPLLSDGITILNEILDTIKQSILIHGIPTKQRYDEFLLSILPNKVFICIFITHFIIIFTSSIYLILNNEYQHIQFIIFCIYSFCIYSLIIILSLFSVKSSKINTYLHQRLKIKKSKYCDSRYIYCTMIYWICMSFICLCTMDNDGVSTISTVCLLSALNTFHLSFPVFLLVDIFNLNVNQYMDTFKHFFVGDEKGSIESIKMVLSLLQTHDVKYRAFIIVNIIINMVLLEVSMLYSLWIPMPYSAISLFILSFSIKTDMKWALSVHLPITYSLFKSCFVFISVIDVEPTNASLWILIIIIRCMMSIIGCLQIDRAIHWLTISMQKWSDIDIDINDININNAVKLCTHCVTLYFICCLLLYFGDLEQNYLISWLFVIFGIKYGATLIISMGYILCTANYCLSFFIFNISICLRFYVICSDLWIAKLISFVAAVITFIILNDDDHTVYPNDINDRNKRRYAMVSSMVLYLFYGCFYECNWLIVVAAIVFVVFLFQEMRSGCIALIIVVILVIALFQTGFMFQLSWFSIDKDKTFQTLEFALLQRYFERIVHL